MSIVTVLSLAKPDKNAVFSLLAFINTVMSALVQLQASNHCAVAGNKAAALKVGLYSDVSSALVSSDAVGDGTTARTYSQKNSALLYSSLHSAPDREEHDKWLQLECVREVSHLVQ